MMKYSQRGIGVWSREGVLDILIIMIIFENESSDALSSFSRTKLAPIEL